MLLTLITLARVSAPLQVRLQPEKFTVITEVLFFMALQRTAKKIIHSDAVTANQAKKNAQEENCRSFKWLTFNTTISNLAEFQRQMLQCFVLRNTLQE